ncbi:hypothetical protein [Nitratifractor salsuginis]|uniref:hypothetical protein n=1 Tax=Nitratifractor salsuginis TaxID=269261 RepID=UPI0011D16DC2|nr:hypothetical protein [Nitratifractor salsuginis]
MAAKRIAPLHRGGADGVLWDSDAGQCKDQYRGTKHRKARHLEATHQPIEVVWMDRFDDYIKQKRIKNGYPKS